MPTRLHHEVLIDAPTAAVWAALADLEGVAAYNPGVERAERLGEQREGVGAARRCTFRMGGAATERVTEWEAERAMTLALTDHAWPMANARFRIVLEPASAGATKLVQDTEYEPSGDPATAEPVRTQWDQGVTAVLAAFKRHVEQR